MGKKIVISRDYGSMVLPKEILDELSIEYVLEDDEPYYNVDDIVRDNEQLIRIVEDNAEQLFKEYEVKVVEIPDDTTDWKIYDHDGVEWVTYVLDGKLCEVW